MKVLVTGGAGFIGSHVVDALRARGDEVVCVDSLDPQVHRALPAYLRTDVSYCFADLRHWRPDDRLRGVEAVVHLAALGGVGRAAREPANLVDANCGGTARLLELLGPCTTLRRVVLASSFSIYGASYRYRCPACGTETGGDRNPEDLAAGRYEVRCPRCGAESEIQPITNAAAAAPLETYGASKYMQELCLRGFDRAPVSILRFSSVYGTRLRLDDGEATIIAKLAGWIRAGHRPTLLEDGRQIRDWVFVGDVVAAVLALVDGSPAGPVTNVCSGLPTTLLEACERLAEVEGVQCEPRVVGGFRPGDMRHCLGDAAPLARLIGREPVPFAVGAARAFGEGAYPAAAACSPGRSERSCVAFS